MNSKYFLLAMINVVLMLTVAKPTLAADKNITDKNIADKNAAERNAVVLINGCTGFIVEGNYLVSAKHCQHLETVTVVIQKKKVIAHKVYNSNTEDGPVVFRLQGGPFESLQLAKNVPKVGDAVYSLGYPGGHWARIEGEIIGGNGTDLNYTNHRVATGNSGGPLLNKTGKVIGIALHVDADLSVHRSGFASWKVTTDAIVQAKNRNFPRTKRERRKTVVVVFSSKDCRPCNELKKDVQAGHFTEYEFQFVNWDAKTKRWSHPELYREFWKTSQPEEQGLSFPTIWVRGTKQYRVGYNSSRKGGLLGWLSNVVRHFIEGIIGHKERPSISAPEPPSVPEPELEPAPNSSLEKGSAVQQLLKDIVLLREEAMRTKADLEKFKSAGVIGKLKSIATLKTDKEKTLQQVAKVKNDIEAIRKKFREQPLQFLWGLFGLLTGIAHKKFLN